MKITVNKSAKRVLSLVLAIAMLVGTLSIANVGATIVADATTAPIKEGTIDLLEFGSYLTEMGSESTYYDSILADKGETGTEADPIIIDSAEEFVYLSKQGGGGNTTAGKFYKVADGIAGFDLSAGNLDFNGTLAANLDKIKNGGKNHAGAAPGFQGTFDGNGVTVYGAVINANSGYAGLFPQTYGEVTIKNLNVRLCYFKGGVAGAVIGYHSSNVEAPAIVENCSVVDVYLESVGTSYGNATGAILGRGDSAPSLKEATDNVDYNGDGDKVDTIYRNVPYIIRNCFVKLDEQYFISTAEDGTSASGERSVHGGVAGMAGSNALSVSDCIVIGIKPYALSESTSNDVQHTALSSHFSNVYTTADVPVTNITIGGTLPVQDFSGKIFPLSDANLKGAAAVVSMNLPWFSGWMPGEEGEYPTINQTGEESDTYFWNGTADANYAGGTGTKEDPYIIKTPAHLYAALSTVTDNTNGVAGGQQTSQIFKQGSTTEYVPVYTPYYYKVADGVKNFYFNNVYSNETLDGIKALVASGKAKDWKPGKAFVGHIDGNGVNIYGMYSSNGAGFVQKLDGSAEVKNINFNACYSKGSSQSAILTTTLGSYSNDSTIINVANISVRNSRCESTGNLIVKTTANGFEHDRYAGGMISTGSTAENLIISNCFYDGYSCEIVNGASSTIPSSMVGGIIAGGSGMNNVEINGSVSLGAPLVDEVYVAGSEIFYNRYDKNQGFQVFFNNCYTDVTQQITTAYDNKYDKLEDIIRIEAKDEYEMYDMPTLAWSNWTLVTDGERVFPMPTVSTANEMVGSFVTAIGKGHNYASVGPYQAGNNPYTYTLEGSGTEEDPYIIETAEQLARAIATGGMNLYDRLYYKLGNDIDISGGSWITQQAKQEQGLQYTYTPFGGVLDGDGHTVTGLSAGDTESTGLIPIIDGGIVKNLHLRDATVISGESAGAIAGEIWDNNTDDDIIPAIINCSAENLTITAESYGDKLYIVGYHDDMFDPSMGTIDDCYFLGKNGAGEALEGYIIDHNEDDGVVIVDANTIKAGIENGDEEYTSMWYIGGKDGSIPRLKAQADKMKYVDVDGDGVGDMYTTNDLSSLKNKLLRKSAYQNIYGDVSRNGIVNIADLAILQREIVGSYGEALSDSFFANVKAGTIKIYYGENDNYDAARKVELYLEKLTGADVVKVVSTSKGTVSGANSNASNVYVHANDQTGTPDGELEIIVGNIDNFDAYKTNTVATADNSYAVTYDAAKKVVWLQGTNFTAVEQAAINFTSGCAVNGDVVYTCGATVLADHKKPITVKLDTDFNGSLDTNKTFYYAWGDEFEEDTIDTYKWEHNTQQTEAQNGSASAYNNLEMAPIKDLGKLITVTNGRLSLKRGHDSSLGGDVSYSGVVGSVALDVTPGEDNGYVVWDDATKSYVSAIDKDGSDKYFTSGKVTTSRGMLFKQGYIEFQGQLPADGHAFPAWWLMGRPAQSQTNSGYDNSLFGKVYKLNQNWDGVTNTWDKTNLDTFKYQIPSAIYEIDMIEVMQHADRYQVKKESSWLGSIVGGSYYDDSYQNIKTATNLYYLNSTIHKWWNNGVTKSDVDGSLRIANWDTYTISSPIDYDSFKTTSTEGSWIHNIGSTQYDFGTATRSNWSGTVYWDTRNFQQTAHDKLAATRKYGFSWNTNGTGFEATLYIYNTAGTAVETTVPIASGMSDYAAFKDKDKTSEKNGAIGTVDGGAYKDIYSDAKVFNQYMYILFDNKYYSSNDNVSNTANNMFTDLLTSMGLKSFEIDYVRVYQQDGERDIVTPETESFNNNNHFGY